MRLVLLGQSLITHDLRAVHWPDRVRLTEQLVEADAVFTDLEVTLQGAGTPTREGTFLHTAPPSVLSCLSDLGVSMLGLANNHAWDLGTEGLLATRAACLAHGFTVAGTGADIDSAFAPGFRQTPQGRVGIVAFAAGKIRPGAAATADRPGVAELRLTEQGDCHPDDLSRVLNSVRQAVLQADAVIACLHNHHWEPDRAATPAWQRQLARACIHSGAHVFVGHGSPELHGIEHHRGRPILHGLGSFIFQSVTPAGHYPPQAWQSVIAILDTETGALELMPLILDEAGTNGARGVPCLASRTAAAGILSGLKKLSKELELQENTA